jgi:hypothetical protein
MVFDRLLHQLVRVLRASTHRAPRVAICLRQLSRRRPGSKNLLQFPVATLAGVLRCSLLPASRGVPLLVGRHFVWLGGVA